jgi:dihydrofolate reductase
MGKVVVELTMSLDGFIAGPNDGPEHPLGLRDGESIFNWYFSGNTPSKSNKMFKPKGKNREVVDAMFESTGAILSGRRTYDITHGWKGTHPINGVPVVVLTHRTPADVPKGKSKFTFVADIGKAVELAKDAAGAKNVGVLGASAAQQCIRAGLVDEFYIHLAPILVGAGVRLFEDLGSDSIKLELIKALETPEATHLRFRVVPAH